MIYFILGLAFTLGLGYAWWRSGRDITVEVLLMGLATIIFWPLLFLVFISLKWSDHKIGQKILLKGKDKE
jgi:hypothetical protein